MTTVLQASLVLVWAAVAVLMVLATVHAVLLALEPLLQRARFARMHREERALAAFEARVRAGTELQARHGRVRSSWPWRTGPRA